MRSEPGPGPAQKRERATRARDLALRILRACGRPVELAPSFKRLHPDATLTEATFGGLRISLSVRGDGYFALLSISSEADGGGLVLKFDEADPDGPPKWDRFQNGAWEALLPGAADEAERVGGR